MRTLTIPQTLAGQRLDLALAQLTGESRHQIQRALKEAQITQASDLPATAKQAVTGGEVFTWLSPTVEAVPLVPELTILYEDNDILAIDKPAGLVVHASETGRSQPTVAAFAVHHGVVDDDPTRPGIVHRLDKDTSGVMLLAKHPEAKAWLQRRFKDREVSKTYTALVRGHLRQPEAIIRLPIGRDRKAPVKRAVIAGAREAVTAYRVLQTYASTSLLEIQLHTGRTHQIRVHFQHLGHPVIGDTLYGEHTRPPGLTRQFLHASRVELQAPNGKPVVITSPLPGELQAFLRQAENSV